MSGAVDVATMGETMALLQPLPDVPVGATSTLRRSIAGAESNFAIALTRLGRSVSFLSRVGDDAFGRAIISALDGERVCTSQITIDQTAPTGIMVREPGRNAEPIVDYHRRGSAASQLDIDDVPPEWLSGARYVHLTGITPALSNSCRRAVFHAIELARANGSVVVFDPNVRMKLWNDHATARRVLLDIAGHADIVLPGAAELEFLTGTGDPTSGARNLLDQGATLIAIKLGPAGSISVSESEVITEPGHPVLRVVDPIGAGDAWAAGLLSVLIDGESTTATPDLIRRSLRRANLVGALATTFAGDWEGLPRLAEVESHERQQPVTTR